MIKETFYKDRPAIEISCDEFSAVFLPLDGAKLASFKTKDGEELLLQTEGEKYRRLDLDGSFEKSECSGFDDMFPAIDPCVINGLHYLDHGEVCRREHSAEIAGDKVTFSCTLPILNILFKKTVYCENGALLIEYSIENNNNFDFPYVWAAHAMFKGEDGAYAHSNFPPDAPKTFLSGNPDKNAPQVLPPRGSQRHYKYYYNEAKSPLKCGMVYPQSRTEVTMEILDDTVKYLGFWVNPGDLNGAYTLAVEPCTAPFDNPIKAQKVNAASYIKAHQKAEFTLKLSYKKN